MINGRDTTRRRGCGLALSVLLLAGCRGLDAEPPPSVPAASITAAPVPAGSIDPDVAATLATVIGSAHHPEMKWPDIPDVAPSMKDLYAAEPDGLFWFDGATTGRQRARRGERRWRSRTSTGSTTPTTTPTGWPSAGPRFAPKRTSPPRSGPSSISR